MAGLGEARRVNDLLGSLAEHPGWSPDWSSVIGPDQPRYSPLIGGHFTVSTVYAIATPLRAIKIAHT